MSSVIIQQIAPFGGLTNSMIGSLYSLNGNLPRLQAAINNASSGFTGPAGTEYEGTATLFGVTPDANTPGQQGQTYASAIVTIVNAWTTFWQAASGAIDTLDNGQRGF